MAASRKAAKTADGEIVCERLRYLQNDKRELDLQTMTDNAATAPTVSVPLYFEDLSIGQRFVSRSHTITADEIKAFASRYDPQPFHLDEEAARDTMFEGLAASGWHTAALTMSLIVETLSLAGGVIGGGGELMWPRPTRPGDTLRVEVEVLELHPSRSRPERGTAMMRYLTINQHDEVVQSFTVKMPLRRCSHSPNKTTSS